MDTDPSGANYIFFNSLHHLFINKAVYIKGRLTSPNNAFFYAHKVSLILKRYCHFFCKEPTIHPLMLN